MRPLILALGLSSLVLTGCNKAEAPAGTGTGTGSATASGAAVKREPGSWKNSITLAKFDLPGAPPEMKGMMEKMMASAGGVEMCLSKEAAAKDNMAESLAKAQGSSDCTFSKRSIAGGKLDVAGTCKDRTGQTMTMAMTGTVGAKASDVNMDIKGKAPTGGEMNMVMNVKSEWTGPCKPGQPEMKS